jgi:hypothetical protein
MENNCENCKYWGQLIAKKFRRCLKSKMADSPMYSGCGLNTKKDFGCKLFEEKQHSLEESKNNISDNGLLDSVKLVNKEDLTDDFKDNYLGGNS